MSDERAGPRRPARLGHAGRRLARDPDRRPSRRRSRRSPAHGEFRPRAAMERDPIVQAGHPVPRAARRRALVPDAPDAGRRRRAAPRPLVDRRRRPPQPGRRRPRTAGCAASGARRSSRTSSREFRRRPAQRRHDRRRAASTSAWSTSPTPAAGPWRSARPTSSPGRSRPRRGRGGASTGWRPGAGSSSTLLEGAAPRCDNRRGGPVQPVTSRRLQSARMPAPARRLARDGRWRSARGATRAPSVVVLPTTGIVDSVMAGYLEDGIAEAAHEGAAAVVIKLNTPGGSLDATNEIVGTLLEADVPVIVWVAPAGGFAASAGTFITLAGERRAHGARDEHRRGVAGAADGEDIPGTLGDKVINDAIAKITVDRRGARPERRVGGLDRREGRLVAGERGGRGRGRRRDRRHDRGGPRVRRRPRGRRSTARRSRSTSPGADVRRARR